MKTYKGIELFKAVANYELKNGTKLKCVHSGIYGQGIEVAEDKHILIWSDDKKPISYAYFEYSDFEFEIMEEKPKKIEELELVSLEIFKTMTPAERYHVTAKEYDKINDLTEAVNYLLEKESDK